MYPIELPNSWKIIKAKQCVQNEKNDIVDGPFGSNLKASEYIDTGVPVLRIQNIKMLRFVDKNIKYISEKKAHELIRHSFQSEDILITKLGDPLGLACFIPKTVPHGIIVADLVRLRPDPKIINPKYLLYLINSTIVSQQILEHIKGTTRPRINLSVIRNLTIPLAPKEEQKQIATKLDDLLAQIDNIKTRLEAIFEILNKFRQSVLSSAINGTLTKDWRQQSNESRNFINREFYICKDKIKLEEKYFCDADSWQWIRLGNVAKLINGDRGKNYPNKSEYVDSGIPFINTGHIEKDGTLSEKKMNYISDDKFNSLGSGRVRANDLIYCLRGATMGKTAIISQFSKGAIASSLVIVRPDKFINTKFLYMFLISPQGKNFIKKYDNGSAQPNLSAKSLSKYTIALPPMEEQKQIVKQVEQLFEYADKIQEKTYSSLKRVDLLTQSILHSAFSGKLTKKWRETNLTTSET